MLIIDLRPLYYVTNIYAIKHPQFYVLEENDLLFMVRSIIANSAIHPPIDVSYILIQSEMINRHPELIEVYSILEDLIQDLENTLLSSIPYGGTHFEHRVIIKQHGPIASIRSYTPNATKDTHNDIVDVPHLSYILHPPKAGSTKPASFDF